MSTISVYTTTYNAIEQEYCIVEGIRSALGFADEVIVVDSNSTDDTIDAIKSIGDDRVKIYSIDWLPNIGWAMYKIAKSMSIGRCTKEWCVLMDADEVFHEDDSGKIRGITDCVGNSVSGIRFNTLHFYKDYRHVLNGSNAWKDLYTSKTYMVRNGLGIHHGNSGMDIDAHVDRHGIPVEQSKIFNLNVNVFHYGHVRSAEAYAKKQNRMHSFYEGKELVYSSPKEIDIERLNIFSGDHPKEMKNKVEKHLVI